MALVTKSEVKRHLNIPEAETVFDSELDIFIAAAKPIIEYIVGAIEQRTVTESYNTYRRTSIVLQQLPVFSITSIKEYLGPIEYVLTSQPPGSVSIDTYGYWLKNSASGLIERRMQGYRSAFLGTEAIVVYVTGRSTTPDNLKLATLEDIRALWTQTQNAARPTFGGGGVVMGPDNWNQDLHMFPRLAAISTADRLQGGIA